jgi:hypothetical protein
MDAHPIIAVILHEIIQVQNRARDSFGVVAHWDVTEAG